MATTRSPIVAIRRHKAVAAVLAVAGVAAGVGLAMTQPTLYTAEARLAVGGSGGLAAESVPGFVVATQQLASNYARYVNNAQSQSMLETDLGIDPGTLDTVSASPIPESNVVRIEVVTRNRGTAEKAVTAVATALMDEVNNSTASGQSAAATLAKYTDISQQVAVAQQTADAAKAALSYAGNQPGAPGYQQATKAAADAATQLASLQVQQDALAQKYRNQVASSAQGAANLSIVENAALTGDNRISRAEQYGLAGLAIGLVAAFGTAVVLERRRPVPAPVPAEHVRPGTAGDEPRPEPEHRVHGSAPVAVRPGD